MCFAQISESKENIILGQVGRRWTHRESNSELSHATTAVCLLPMGPHASPVIPRFNREILRADRGVLPTELQAQVWNLNQEHCSRKRKIVQILIPHAGDYDRSSKREVSCKKRGGLERNISLILGATSKLVTSSSLGGFGGCRFCELRSEGGDQWFGRSYQPNQ